MEDMTTRYLNVEGRAKALKSVDTRMNCADLGDRILTDEQCYAYAICEELDRMASMQNSEGE